MKAKETDVKTKMLGGVNPVGNTIDRGISIIVYGDPGRGKTTCAATLPVGETLIINTEAGLGPLLGTGHLVFNLRTDLKELEGLYKYLRTEDHPFKNVVIDNISELQDWMLRVLFKGRGKDFPDIRERGDVSTKMKEYVSLFRDLTTERNMNVIFNAWEESFEVERSDAGTTSKIGPKVTKGIVEDVCGKVDAVGHLEVFEKTGDRFIRFTGTSKMIAKCQFKGLHEENGIILEEANLPNIISKVKAYSYARKGE